MKFNYQGKKNDYKLIWWKEERKLSAIYFFEKREIQNSNIHNMSMKVSLAKINLQEAIIAKIMKLV